MAGFLWICNEYLHKYREISELRVPSGKMLILQGFFRFANPIAEEIQVILKVSVVGIRFMRSVHLCPDDVESLKIQRSGTESMHRYIYLWQQS